MEEEYAEDISENSERSQDLNPECSHDLDAYEESFIDDQSLTPGSCYYAFAPSDLLHDFVVPKDPTCKQVKASHKLTRLRPSASK